MSDHKIVYLIVERGIDDNRRVFWRSAGNAFVCRDGSLNVRLDIHPGLTFNIRDPKSNGEREEAAAFPNLTNGNGNGSAHTEAETSASEVQTSPAKTNGRNGVPPADDDIPF